MNLKTVTGAAVELSEITFGREFNEALVHQVVTAYLAGARQGTRALKTRGEVSGGGKKPWRQKGTGRARAGSIRSPIWVGGGRAFAAKPQDWSQKVNRKMYRGAMQCILAELVIAKLADLNAPRALIVTHEVDENLYLAARNIPYVNVLGTREVDPVSLVSFDKVIMTVEAAKQFEETLA